MRIYAPNSTPAQLATNGIGNILCESAVVHEELNGEFSLTIKVAQASPHFDNVVIGAIVKADTPCGEQFFRLSKPTEMLDGGKEAFAWHISYDLDQDIILNRAWTNKTGVEALPDILQAGISERRFTGTSDISQVASMRIVRTSVLRAIIGEQDNSYVNRWHGEIERNNFTVNMKSRLGADRGVVIEYRKNLTGLIYEEDDDQLVNRIIPTGLDIDDAVIMLPEIYIDSEKISETPIPHVRHIHFSDIKVGAVDDDENLLYGNADDVRNKLRELVAEMFDQGADQPLKSATVNFIDLSQTEEYKDISMLQTVEIGDTVRCKYKSTAISLRVVLYDYDSLTKKYINIVLGTEMPMLGDLLRSQDQDILDLQEEISGGYASLKLTVDGLVVTVGDAEGDISTLQQTASSLTTRISTAEGAISSIDQYVDSLTLSVTNGSTSSTLKLMAGSTEISSQSISFSGMVAFSNLTDGSTTISGSNIKTGTIAASRIDVDNLGVKHLSGADGTFSYLTTIDSSTGYGMQLYWSSIRFTKNSGSTWSGQIDVDATYGMRLFSSDEVNIYTTGVGKWVNVWGSFKVSTYAGESRFVMANPATASGGSECRWVDRTGDLGGWSLGRYTSSRKYKDDIKYFGDEYGIDICRQLKPATFTYIDDDKKTINVGMIAEDVYEVCPDVVAYHNNEPDSLQYSNMVALAISAIQNLDKRLIELEGVA